LNDVVKKSDKLSHKVFELIRFDSVKCVQTIKSKLLKMLQVRSNYEQRVKELTNKKACFYRCCVMFDPSVCEPEDVVDQTDDQLSEHEDTMTSDLQNNVTEIRQTTEAGDGQISVLHITNFYMTLCRFPF